MVFDAGKVILYSKAFALAGKSVGLGTILEVVCFSESIEKMACYVGFCTPGV